MARKLIQQTGGVKDSSGAYVKAPTDAPPEPFRLDKFLFPQQLKFVEDPRPFKVAVCSRRCLAKGTLVMTAKGPKAIETVKVGDTVYNEHGKQIKVKATFVNGVKEVWDVKHAGVSQLKCTEDHIFLTENTYRDKLFEKPLKDFNSRDKIKRVEVKRVEGKKVFGAYALGALLGDGCSVEPGKILYISSQNNLIPDAIAKELGTSAKKLPSHNYTWKIPNFTKVPDFYAEWCAKRHSYEKRADLEEVISWNRECKLQFLAGLIDTDGSVENLVDGLCIRLGMQAETIIKTAAMLFLDLWGYLPTIRLDDRPKYKNGPLHCFAVKHNYFAKKALRELDPYLNCAHKKWQDYYQYNIENNYRPDRVGVTVEGSSFEETYDISVDSETNLYLLANGFVTHNSGKTVACAAHLIATALETPEVVCLYITLSRNNAKKLIWRELQKINKKYKLGATEDATELSMSFPNGSIIYCSGAKDASEIEKFRGLALKLVYVDECQSFRAYIQELIDDILSPALMDYAGTLCLIGTPSATPAGFFAEISGNVQDKLAVSEFWSKHAWTFFDNPFITQKSGKTHQQLLDRELKRRGVEITDPSIQREFFGRWVLDSSSLWIRYDAKLNHYISLPTLPNNQKWNYILGIDLGFIDADALAVLAWSELEPATYLVEEKVIAKQGLTELVEQIKELQTRYDISKMVIDEGGLGKKLAEEMRRRHHLPVEAADKVRKQENVEFLNDTLRTGKFKAKSASKFAQDTLLVEIDRAKSTPDKIRISDKYHSDIIDAVLYAFKCSPAFTYQAKAALPSPGTDEWNRKQQDDMFEAAQQHFQEQADLQRRYNGNYD